MLFMFPRLNCCHNALISQALCRDLSWVSRSRAEINLQMLGHKADGQTMTVMWVRPVLFVSLPVKRRPSFTESLSRGCALCASYVVHLAKTHLSALFSTGELLPNNTVYGASVWSLLLDVSIWKWSLAAARSTFTISERSVFPAGPHDRLCWRGVGEGRPDTALLWQ